MVQPPKRRCPPGTVPVPNPPRCVPIGPGRPGGPGGVPGFGANFGGTPSGGFFPFSNSAGGGAAAAAGAGPAVTPGPGPTPPPPPPVIDCHDVLTVVPFSVPFTSTVNVSGGGAALQTAVTAAGPGTRLVIMDSLTYNGNLSITGKTNLTIEAAAGQTPVIQASAGVAQSAIRLGAGNSGVAIRGLTLMGNGNQNGGSQTDNGILLGSVSTGMATIDRVIVEDCIFNDLNPSLGVPGIQLVGTNGTVHDNVWIHRCTVTDCATPLFATGAGYGAITVGGFNNVYIQNSLIRRSAVARASSHMRGICVKNLNTLVEDVLANDLGTAGSNEAFKHVSEAIFGSTVGPSSWRNCVAYNCKRWYRIALAGTTMTIRNSVGDNDVAGISAGQTLIQQSAGTLSITDSVLVGAGDGTTFTATVTENHNDVFNFAATGKVLDATDITIDPLFEDVPNGDWKALAPAAQTAASDGGLIGIRYQAGEKIIWCNH